MITKKDNLKDASDKFPEIGGVLAESGLHCVGCHAAANETIEEGCLAHGMEEKEIDALVKRANDKVKEFDTMEGFNFTPLAVTKLKEKLLENKSKYVRVFPVFGGFDFDVTDEKYDAEIELKKEVLVLINPKVERFLRGVIVDFDKEANDFSAKRKDD